MNNLKGYGFRPSEEELIGYLNGRTLHGRDYLVQAITDLELDICRWEPWDLPGHSRVTPNDPVWYFIYPITYKHPNSQQKMINNPTGKRMPINRSTKDGNWKVSGDRVKVKASNSTEEIGIKTRLYFYTSDVNEENDSHKNKATKQQNHYQKKTPWVLYEYELINIDPSQNKYFLGKLMKQSEPTKISSNKGETSQQLPSGHILAPEVQQDFSQEPLVEMEVSNYDWNPNQTSISEPANGQFVNQFLVSNYENYPDESLANAENEVISNLQPPNVENYVADYAAPQNLQADLTREPEEPNICSGAETSNQHNIDAEKDGLDLPFDFNNYPITDVSQMKFQSDDDGFYPHELLNMLEPEAFDNNGNGVQNQSSINQQVADGQFKPPEDNNNDGVQNLSSISQQVADGNDGVQNRSSIDQQDADGQLMNSKFTDNEILYPDERSKAANVENHVADYAAPQNLQADLTREPEEPNICSGAETSNQHNIDAEKDGLDLPFDFNNYRITDDMIQRLFQFYNGLYLDELPKKPEPEAFDNNCNGVQNQSSIDQQVADGQFKPPEDNNNDGVQNLSSISQQVADGNDGVQNRSSIDQQDADGQLMNSKFTDNEILYPDERSKAASADMELVRKRSAMELEGSSIDIETELAQAQAKKSRF